MEEVSGDDTDEDPMMLLSEDDDADDVVWSAVMGVDSW